MTDRLLELQQENQRLNLLLEKDWLTNTYNKGAAEKKISEQLERCKRGVLLTLDVDNFKKVNDLYGHMVGDELLTAIAEQLRAMFLRNDIIGRVGGDQFAVYISAAQKLESAQQRAVQVRQQLRNVRTQNCDFELSVAAGAAVYQEGDDYRSLFARADADMMKQKRERKKQNGKKSAGSLRGIEMDMIRISAELEESQIEKGAYFRDYETFKSIYRFVERRLERLETKSYIVLLTLTDNHQELVNFEKNDVWMDILHRVIQQQLRAGDVFSQYSSCQYLIMLSDLDEDQADRVAERITKAFYQQADAENEHMLLHHCYPMKRRKK